MVRGKLSVNNKLIKIYYNCLKIKHLLRSSMIFSEGILRRKEKLNKLKSPYLFRGLKFTIVLIFDLSMWEICGREFITIYNSCIL